MAERLNGYYSLAANSGLPDRAIAVSDICQVLIYVRYINYIAHTLQDIIQNGAVAIKDSAEITKGIVFNPRYQHILKGDIPLYVSKEPMFSLYVKQNIILILPHCVFHVFVACIVLCCKSTIL